MFGLLALLFLLVPIAELYVIVQVAGSLGVLETIAVLIGISVLGAWLVKREGLGIVARVQREVGSGRLPTDSVVDGFLVLFAGALLMTPGFLTDLMGILLLLPPTRAVIRVAALRWFRRRAAAAVASGVAGSGSATSSRFFVYDLRTTGNARPDVIDADVIDGEVIDVDPSDRTPPGRGDDPPRGIGR